MHLRRLLRRARVGETVIPTPTPTPTPSPSVSLSGSFPDMQNGAAYSGSMAISGGAPPYTLSLVSGSLPPGFTAAVVGNELVISGIEAS